MVSVGKSSNKTPDIKFYILDDFQLIKWFGAVLEKGTSGRYEMPENFVGAIKQQVTSGKFSVDTSQYETLHFIFDNRYSDYTEKRVVTNFNEVWDEVPLSLDLVTTIPPLDKSLRTEVEQMIIKTKNDLKVISPYIDTSFLQEIFARQSQGATIRLVTRPDKDFTGKDKIAALRYIKQNIQANRKTNELVHSRIIIRDNEQALISSADITHDSLVAQFNAGIVVSDPNVIKKLLDYFGHVWDSSQ